jgi:hypothetical protein
MARSRKSKASATLANLDELKGLIEGIMGGTSIEGIGPEDARAIRGKLVNLAAGTLTAFAMGETGGQGIIGAMPDPKSGAPEARVVVAVGGIATDALDGAVRQMTARLDALGVGASHDDSIRPLGDGPAGWDEREGPGYL